MPPEQTKGFSGILDRIRLADLVQTASIGEMSADLEIHSAMDGGLISIRSGRIGHCESGPACGEEALRRIFSWPGGSFEFKPAQSEIPQSIKKSWEQLLIECICRPGESDQDPAGPEAAFSGRIDGMDLLELVELCCLSMADRALIVKMEDGGGAIFFNEKGVFHAECGAGRGESAFNEMALAERGTFESIHPEGDEPVTIERPWDDLLVRAKRHRDESRPRAQEGRATNFLQQIQRTKLTDKIRLALTGQKEARTILARDSNKMVQLAVIDNPKISASEVALIAASKSTEEEVFRRITASREWMRLHQIRAALVNNPKCPIAISVKLVETLGQQDWKRIAASRSVPSVVSATAKRLMSKKK